MPVTPVVSYLPTGLAGCSVDPGISCGARKLAGHSGLKKKKKLTLTTEFPWVGHHNFYGHSL